MNTWKLSIKPDSQSGYDPFKLCKDKSLLGVGWSGAYENEQALNLAEAKRLVESRYKQWPYAVRKLIEDVKEGDHVWLHQQGHYYLCRANKEIVLGSAIDKQFLNFDLGHARKADWVKVPEIFVSGVVQRGTIAQRIIQKINITSKERNCHELLFDKLANNPNWLPTIDKTLLTKKIAQLGMNELFSIMTPDEIEDTVSAYLQTDGWILVKSTCFRSKPTFEFSMINRKSETCYVQIKSGKNPDRLLPSPYEKYVADKKFIFLFSTNPNAYQNEIFDSITCLAHNDIFTWLIDNLWSMTESLKLKLWVHLCE